MSLDSKFLIPDAVDLDVEASPRVEAQDCRTRQKDVEADWDHTATTSGALSAFGRVKPFLTFPHQTHIIPPNPA
jgi:hypothetical protein